MAGNSFGRIFKITTFGESHGPGIGVVIDGCPSNIVLDNEKINLALQRRRPGQSNLTTQRKESDQFQILSGVFEGKTLGTPITIWIPNENAKSKDYSHIKDSFRPSHADFTYQEKFGIRDYRGGGRASARETAARVAAGAVAIQILERYGVALIAFVTSIGEISLALSNELQFSRTNVEASIVRCPDPDTSLKMEQSILKARKEGDSLGGIIHCEIEGVPIGIGEPVFDKLEAHLAQAMLSIPACKGFEIGSGFSGTKMFGSEHNDVFINNGQSIVTETNFSGGIQGGISNGMPIHFNVAFKPVATIMKPQDSIDVNGKSVVVKGKGRHDPCVLPRAVPIVEAMAALVILDFTLLQQARKL